MTKVTEEREGFAARLKLALRNANYSPDSATQLSREFNMRFSGHPISLHAARKWLFQESIPTQDKIRVLSQWLGVPSDWLRYGDENHKAKEGEVHDSSTPFASADVRLIAELRSLDEKSQNIAREFIRLLIRIKGSK